MNPSDCATRGGWSAPNASRSSHVARASRGACAGQAQVVHVKLRHIAGVDAQRQLSDIVPIADVSVAPAPQAQRLIERHPVFAGLET
jgi:hypothetical protein